jgi:hypothetical protein
MRCKSLTLDRLRKIQETVARWLVREAMVTGKVTSVVTTETHDHPKIREFGPVCYAEDLCASCFAFTNG